ncbi:MAG: hypothetical protein HC828_09480 [Blastochloris sp.]|nr:hypothetical protein [Blastochloris sp.]
MPEPSKPRQHAAEPDSDQRPPRRSLDFRRRLRARLAQRRQRVVGEPYAEGEDDDRNQQRDPDRQPGC